MTCTVDTKRLMFEIYKDSILGGYRVVYFTELGEHEREEEIGNALRGDHVFDGFILHRRRHEAKVVINGLLSRMNSGEQLPAALIEEELRPFLAL
jgi:TolB-like protein